MLKMAVFMVVAIAVAAGAAAQDVILLDAQRGMDADLFWFEQYDWCGGDQEAHDPHSIEDVGFWHQMLDAEIVSPSDHEQSIQAHGVQYSDVTENGVSFYGYLDFEFYYGCGCDWNSSAGLQSSSRTRILVTAPTTVVLSGIYAAELRSENAGYAPLYATAEIVVDKLAGQTVYEDYIPAVLQEYGDAEILLEQPLSAAVELQPGIYDVQLTVAIDVPQFWMYGQLWVHSAELGHVIDMEFLPGEVEPECEYVDSDNDGDVDLRDFYFYQQCFTGPGR